MRKKSITIAVFLDGLGWRLTAGHGFLRDELPYRGPLATTFGGNSSGDAQMGRSAGLANLRDLLCASVGIFRLAARPA